MGPMAGHDTSLRVPASCRPGEHHKTRREVTEIVEEYVEGIFRLREALGKVTTGDLAEYMCVSAGSASAMLRRLKDLRLVKHEPYRSIELTEEGERLAKQLTRTHRILKRFLVDVVGLPWNDVHEIACKLEHHVSGDVVDQIFDRLGRPATCPHGNPIDPDTEDGSIPLYRAAEGQVWVVQKVTNEGYDFLRFLEEAGLVPGRKVEVEGRTEFDDLVHLRAGDRKLTVGRDVSRHVWVRRA
ncbi:MAG: metal-dependent transcriptional regulator [Armatimonadetes bacterium]|nr:MAG: metal-dependent transcriptional regulator [Armatimonadota bacterium]MCE7898996.1 metal-dependent transcriptional regulator [Armatimonadetes bacterium ATM1]MDL1927451.1 metal-dependent transcriptional regulator [Fimbriimonadia bacterium ATM]MBC6969728.1 metal-dependent transcriptional regulator [Armatimonadota bacterium]MBL1149165.1 metal-dependent transcriptional regulator [Armatimonadota bacterium]